MSSFEVVLDANVLFPPLLRDFLLEMAAANLYRPKWSLEILDEVSRNLVEKKQMTQAKADNLMKEIKDYFPDAIVELASYKDLINVMRNDPKDRHVLAVAVSSKAQVIVTSNLKDFPEVALSTYNVEAQSPDTFLSYQFDLGRSVTIDILRKIVRDKRKPPYTSDQILNQLEKQIPNTVKSIREYLINLQT